MIFEYLLNVWPFRGILLQAVIYEVSKSLIPVIIFVESRWGAIHYLQNDFHCRKLLVGCFTVCDLNGCDTSGPNVCCEIVASLLHDLRCHPTGRTYKSFSLLAAFELG